MNISELISAGFIGSVITLGIKSLVDMINARNLYKRELKKQVFQRKTDAVEKAISWYQEALDTYGMMQLAFKEMKTYTPTTFAKLQVSVQKADNLFREAPFRLNPIYLYYTFSDIEIQNHATESQENLNEGIMEIISLNEKMNKLHPTENAEEYDALQKRSLTTYEKLYKAVEEQKNIIIAIQNRLRNEYRKYLS